MKWQKTGKRNWEAKGIKGTFYISLRNCLFFIRYSTATSTVRLQTKRKLDDAKVLCEQSEYWEKLQDRA